ncbi:MAG: hypothetical protein IH965_14345 [Gemmatimonadetes bacterium]|nr:hypothetical protein [Gemmatimonadota bacterium]
MARSSSGILAIVVAGLCVPRFATAQDGRVAGIARWTGEVGSYAEAYGINGAEARRPAATGRMYLRPTLSLAGRLTIRFNFLLSTEGRTFQSSRRQSINQYGVNPQWSWGSANLGDFTDSYTPLTFSGVRVRGAGLNVSRGPLWMSMFGGRTQRAVEGGATNGRFERNIFGGRIGIGDRRRSSIGIYLVRAHDDVGSLTLPEDTLFIDENRPDTAFVEDTLQVGKIANPFAVTPQENLVLGVTGNLAVLGDALQLKAELSGSGHTRDLRADVIESEEILSRIPGIVRSIYTPRVSSTADYAYTIEATARTGPLTATGAFRNIGPGYVSLGVASLLSDQRELRLTTQLRFRRWNVRVDGARQHDNLIHQKTFTTRRDRAAVALSLRPGRRWNGSLRAQYSRLDNEAPEPERWIAYQSWMVGTNQTLTFTRRGFLRTASVQYQYRTTGDDNPLRTQSASRSHSVKVRVLLSPSRILNVTPSVGIVRARFAGVGWSTRQTYSLGAQLRMLRGKWMSSLQLGRSQFNQTSALQATLRSRYQLTPHDAISLAVRGSDYGNVLDAARDFQELLITLRWARRL